MRCLWDDVNGAPFNTSLYKVRVGKQFKEYDNQKERDEIQTISITKITKSEEWEGSANGFVGDIAILLLDDHIVFETHIGPVCIDYDLKNYHDKLPDEYLYSVGWYQGDNSSDLSSTWSYHPTKTTEAKDKTCLE